MEDINLSKQDQDHGSPISPSRITIRPLDVSDVDDFLVWAGDEEVARFCTWEPCRNREDGIKYINDRITPHPWFRAICLDRKPIGAIMVNSDSGNNDKCRGEIGYHLGSKYWGKGIVTQAVRLVVESIFKDWPHLERLEALADVQNFGSQRVLEKVGFVREGVLRKYFILKGKTIDMIMYSLLSTDYYT